MLRGIIVALIIGLAFCRTQSDGRTPAGAWFAQELMQRAWARAAIDEPWPWTDASPVARLVAGDVDLIVLGGDPSSTLAFGPGHMATSPLPGERGNSVITGNHETHFRFLADLALGERLRVVLMNGAEHVFEIIDLDVVDARRASLSLDSDVPMLSLITDYPFDAADSPLSLRYVVTARLSD